MCDDQTDITVKANLSLLQTSKILHVHWVLLTTSDLIKKQECIPVGCLPSAAVVVSREGGVCPEECLPTKVSARGVSVRGWCVCLGGTPSGPIGKQPPLPDLEADTPSPVDKILDSRL